MPRCHHDARLSAVAIVNELADGAGCVAVDSPRLLIGVPRCPPRRSPTASECGDIQSSLPRVTATRRQMLAPQAPSSRGWASRGAHGRAARYRRAAMQIIAFEDEPGAQRNR
jgi:hypothetical protein